MNRPGAKRLPVLLILGAVLIGLILGLAWWDREAQSAAAEATAALLEIHFSPPPGEYGEDLMLEISAPHPDARIYFTLDGRLPDPAVDPLYTEPIPLTADPPQVVAVRAQAVLPDGTSGPVGSATYFMNLDTTLPKLSLIVDPDDLYDEETGIYVNYLERGREWERPVDVTYINGEGDTAFHVDAGLRIHGELTRWYFDKKSLRLYFRGEYGPTKLTYPIFGPEGQIEFDKLILHNSGKDLLLFRNQLAERLSADADGYISRSQPTLLFINGEPWGIYHIREAIDQRFLKQNFAVPAADLSDTPNIPSRQSAEQRRVDLVHWENFMAFVEEKNLSDPANYDYIRTQIDLQNFVDYYLLEMYAGNTDWPHHNVEQFRPRTPGGRWEWLVWDNDRAFESIDRQMVEHVLVATHPLGERMETMLNKLLANPEFRNLFLTRAADLLNTTLSTPNVQGHIDDLEAQLGPDIALEKERWDISNEWADTVQFMSDFAAQRPDIMRQHFMESMGLEGTAEITFNQAGDPAGWIVVNEGKPQQLPWSGIYFQGTDITLRAVPPAGYRFAGWEGITDLPENKPLITIPVTGDLSVTPRFEALPAGALQPGDVTIESYHADDRGEIEGDWFELRVNRNGLDLSGWRVTDNDTIEAADEGSIIFTPDNVRPDPLLQNLREGAIIRVIATETLQNNTRYAKDGWQNNILTLYVGNDRLDTQTDPWFNLAPRDNLLLITPGPDDTWIPIDLWSENDAVTPTTFGLPPDRKQPGLLDSRGE
jgi:hypothetical protein